MKYGYLGFVYRYILFVSTYFRAKPFLTWYHSGYREVSGGTTSAVLEKWDRS